ncbi:hypothetical protein Q5P01_006183 [Channa striata]|uniref:Aminopeptidase P N-terminal domain-containing protein n=1 Tax=Channa striata TaxID=64152 RepID=A0AA88N7J0_CHASR|nr:hypothetical protein Q5P01_006183 [Channa striata]
MIQKSVSHKILAVYWLGNDTLRVSAALFAENRERLCRALRAKDEVVPHSMVVLQGGEQKQSDMLAESFFHWAFGVTEADCSGAIDVDSGKSILFVPKLPESYATWMGDLAAEENCRLLSLLPHCASRSSNYSLSASSQIADVLSNLKPAVLLTLGVERVNEAGLRRMEPGTYFINHLLDRARADPAQSCFISSQVLAGFRAFGGVPY